MSQPTSGAPHGDHVPTTEGSSVTTQPAPTTPPSAPTPSGSTPAAGASAAGGDGTDGGGRSTRGRRPLELAGAFVAGVLTASLVGLLVWGPPGGAPAEGPGQTQAPTSEPTPAPEEPTAPTETEEPAEPAPAGEPLTWAPPQLTDPETIEISADNRGIRLEDDQDYILQMPDEPLEALGGITVSGGHNVVLIGGEISIPEGGEGHEVRGVFLRDQTGTVHIEGLRITGPGLGEGFNLDQRRGAVVQLQNIRVDTVVGEQEGHHADVIQTWAGPSVLRVDRLTGHTGYQGFFLLPQQFGDQDEPELFDFRNIDLTGNDDAGYLLWRDGADWPVQVENVWVSPSNEDADRERFLWPGGSDSWDDVQVGTPPDGPFVPEGVAGIGYRSPGYLDESDA